MDYREIHAGIRSMGERALRNRRVHDDYLDGDAGRDEPVFVPAASGNPAPRPSKELITIGGQSWPRWQWEEDLTTGEPTSDERDLIARMGWGCEQDAGNPAVWFVCNPAAICYE